MQYPLKHFIQQIKGNTTAIERDDNIIKDIQLLNNQTLRIECYMVEKSLDTYDRTKQIGPTIQVNYQRTTLLLMDRTNTIWYNKSSHSI